MLKRSDRSQTSSSGLRSLARSWLGVRLRPLASMPRPENGARRAAGGAQSPVVVVDSTLRSHGLGQPKRSQPTPNGIRVEFENVAFDKLVVWLGDLSHEYGMEVQAGSLSASSSDSPRRVNATLTLERSL